MLGAAFLPASAVNTNIAVTITSVYGLKRAVGTMLVAKHNKRIFGDKPDRRTRSLNSALGGNYDGAVDPIDLLGGRDHNDLVLIQRGLERIGPNFAVVGISYKIFIFRKRNRI